MISSYLLTFQARPITSLGQETEDDLIYEFDTPLSSDQELLTTANIGYFRPKNIICFLLTLHLLVFTKKKHTLKYFSALPTPNQHKTLFIFS